MPSCNVSVVCSLFVHHMFPNSNCRVHAQVLSSHGGRLLPFHGWISGGEDLRASLCTSRCTYGLGAQKHPGLLLHRWRRARRQPQWCTTLGGLQNTEKAKTLSRNWGHAHWNLDVSPFMVTWMLSQLYCSPSLAWQYMGYTTCWSITSHRSTVKACSHIMLSPENIQ